MSAATRLGTLMIAALFATAAPHAAGQANNLASVQTTPYGFVVNRPGAKTVSKRNGLRLEIDTRWLNNYGYRPVKVRLHSPTPAKRDHLITIRLFVASWDWRSGSVAVEQDFEIATGQTLAEITITCPQFQTGHRYWWDVWVDGKKDELLSADQSTAWQLTAANANVQANTSPKFLLVGRKSSQVNSSVVPNAEVFDAIGIPIDQLPTRWLDFTAADVISLSPADLQTLAADRPQTLEAIRRWVRAGGQIWVSPMGPRWESLEKVEQSLELPPSLEERNSIGEDASRDAATANDIYLERGWQPLKLGPQSQSASAKSYVHLPTGQIRTVRDPVMIARLESDGDWASTQQATSPQPAVSTATDMMNQPTDSGEWYVERPLGLGRVRAFREGWDPIGFGISWQMLQGLTGFDPASTTMLTTPLTAAMDTTRGWESRHGMTPDSANSDFANLLVPGVGQAPVTEFRVLITLFVLAIGPLNYWLLHRTHRLHLLVLTVPLTAGVLTLALFVYALASDGFGTKVRVRSFTTLDQRTGEAACWARLSYYAGLAPSRGLTMPDDVAIYPIVPGWNEGTNGAAFSANRLLEWNDTGQRLTEGWLRSRTPTQCLMIRARKSPARLDVRQAFQPESDGEGQAGKPDVRVTNELGTTVLYLALADDKNRAFAGEMIGEGASVPLAAVNRDVILRRLQQFIRENEPMAPAALADDSAFFAASSRRRQRRFLRNQYGLDYGLERLGGNLQSGAIEGLVGTDDLPMLNLPPRTYVALTATGPEVSLGIRGATEEASFHVLVGNW